MILTSDGVLEYITRTQRSEVDEYLESINFHMLKLFVLGGLVGSVMSKTKILLLLLIELIL